MRQPIRMAVVGAGRGRTFVESAAQLAGTIELVALCDVVPAALAPWRERGEIRLYSDYAQVLEDPEIEAVCIATPAEQHARQAIAALAAGKHVLSEVSAAFTLQECRDLIGAVESSGLTYMMAENCCYFREVLMVGEMVRRGVFGELVFAEGSYIHSIPDLLFDTEGGLTWRGQWARDLCANVYPTHSLGPICKWLGVNETDALKNMATWQSPALAAAEYLRHSGGPAPAAQAATPWRLPDTSHTMLHTENGVLIEHRLDFLSQRPPNFNRYSLQGTRAAFTSGIVPATGPLVWLQGSSPATAKGVAEGWEPLYKYAAEYEHPLWREHGEAAAKASHGGADYFVLREFAAAIKEGRPPYVDVYDAATWSCVTPLSAQSIESGNAPVDVPRWADSRANTRNSV